MSRGRPNIPDDRLLPSGAGSAGSGASSPAPAQPPARQLQELPIDELKALAEEFGLDAGRYRSPQQLVTAIHERRQLIAAMERNVLLELVRWGRRPVALNASKEQLAQEVVKIKSMSFGGLSRGALFSLARLRNISVFAADDIPQIVNRLKRQEGFFAKLNRKRRSWLGSIVSNIIGEEQPSTDYQFLPPQGADGPAPASGGPPTGATIKEEIAESGLFGGIAGRIKKSADSYINQKLDEIEARIDRKLDEIDRRLGEWRDKEIANRIRILKITLWASVIVAVISLLYSWVKVYVINW